MKHIITTLELDSPIIQKEMRSEDLAQTEVYNLRRIDSSCLTVSIRALMNDVLDLPIKVGQFAIVITSNEDILEEHIIVSTLLRRLQDSITLSVKRNSISVTIPWILDLRERKEISMSTDSLYRGAPGGCSGSCSSCK